MLTTIRTSSNLPANVDSSASPKASPPADNVPKARLNPLLRVAPSIYPKVESGNLYFGSFSLDISVGYPG